MVNTCVDGRVLTCIVLSIRGVNRLVFNVMLRVVHTYAAIRVVHLLLVLVIRSCLVVLLVVLRPNIALDDFIFGQDHELISLRAFQVDPPAPPTVREVLLAIAYHQRPALLIVYQLLR